MVVLGHLHVGSIMHHSKSEFSYKKKKWKPPSKKEKKRENPIGLKARSAGRHATAQTLPSYKASRR
jgi:hypothetical protein